MALSDEDIRGRLAEFAARWGGYAGTERGEAQTFLNELLSCYGTDRLGVGASFEESTASGGFMDMIWSKVCIIEMKRPSETSRLSTHREQALDYWKESGERFGVAPPYVVLCSFQKFEVWKPGEVFTKPKATFELSALPENADALLFLGGRTPGFFPRDELTREAVALVTDIYKGLDERDAADGSVLQDFALQTVWSMFAEDLGMLPSHLFTRLVDGLVDDPNRSSLDDLGQLFQYLAKPGARPDHGLYAGAPYANGGLFSRPAAVHLEPEEVSMLRRACDFNWTEVEPAIFGSLLQGALGRDKQWALGAHYTAEADILKVVIPTIVEPWRARVDECDSVKEIQAAQRDLMSYVVLDPACGSGNFLYVAYRELRHIEERLRTRASELRRAAGLADQSEIALFPIENMKGIEIDPFAVKLARVTMWIGHKLAVEQLGVDEPVLPLVDLSRIRQGDALRVDWPRANAIISNPPYHGDRRIRRELGDAYADWLSEEFGIGIKDYAVYWIRKAHRELGQGERAGMVVTNSLSQGRARSASLEWLMESEGVITNAISSQDWSGEAAVDVSIVNWIKEPASDEKLDFVLDGVEIGEPISASLTPASLAVESARSLPPNADHAFYGCILGGTGFILDENKARELRSKGPQWESVIRPLLTGDDLTQRSDLEPSRWVIDFAFMDLEEAMQFPEALDIVRADVKPQRDQVRRASYRKNWWRFSEPIRGMRTALQGLERYIACPSVAEVGGAFCWVDSGAIATSQATIFAFDDDYSMGVLCSRLHVAWAAAQSSTLENRRRYTPSTAFETFPWPNATDQDRESIGALASGFVDLRATICSERDVGINRLYQDLEEGAHTDLAAVWRDLDHAVSSAYGWPVSAADGVVESNRRLLERNEAILDGREPYAPFGNGSDIDNQEG